MVKNDHTHILNSFQTRSARDGSSHPRRNYKNVLNTTCLNLKADNIETTLPGQPQELRKGPGTGCRKEILRTDQPDTIPEPGIKEIKRVELYSKYRPLIPEEFQDETCPYPGKDVMDRIKAKKNATARERAATKRRKTVKEIK